MKLSLTALLLTVASAAHGQTPLDEKAAKAWYPGITVEGETNEGRPFKAYHSPDGKIRAVVDGQHQNDGTWVVRQDGAVCIDWKDTAWGKNPCHWIKQQGELWIIERIDDSKTFVRVKRTEGNTYRM